MSVRDELGPTSAAVPRPWLERLRPYSPGRPAPSGDGSMASNESVLGASPAAKAAVAAAAAGIHRYPDSLADDLRQAVAGMHGVHPDQVLVGNGSDELLYDLALAYVGRSGRALCADPPYRICEISSYAVGASVIAVPLRDWRHDLAAMAGVPADVAYVVNPHNPTGTACPHAAIEEFARRCRARLVVVDEAYVDFADAPNELSAVDLARDGRLVVLRTFSKAFGLAGVRVGYLVGSADVVAALRKVRPPFSVSSVAQAAALAALADMSHRDRVRDETIRLRSALVRVLEAAGYEVVPSQANFVLVPCAHEAHEAHEAAGAREARLVEHFFRHGISVRAGSALGIPGSVRISVPSERGLAMLEEALSSSPAPADQRSRGGASDQ